MRRRISIDVAGSQRVAIAHISCSKFDTSMSSSTTITILHPYTVEPQLADSTPACLAWPG